MSNGIIHYAICHSKLFVHRTVTENELQRKIDGKEVKITDQSSPCPSRLIYARSRILVVSELHMCS